MSEAVSDELQMVVIGSGRKNMQQQEASSPDTQQNHPTS